MTDGYPIDDVASPGQEDTDGPTQPELVAVVVEDDDAPDRCTFYHPESSGVDRMSQWITTEADLVVDLFSVR